MAPPPRKSVAKTVLFIVLIAGTLDIADALVFYGLRFHLAPRLLLQNIASHLLGRSAFAEGIRSAALGLVLHYLIAAAWITLFVLVAQRLPLLFRRAALCGPLYGLIIYAIMNFVVLPRTIVLSPPTHNPLNLLNAVLALVFFMGLTVALLNRKLAPRPTRT